MNGRRTSEQAYAAIVNSGRISEVRRAVYAYLYANGPKTRNDIDRALAPGRPNPPHSRRLVEMEAMGIIERVGQTAPNGGGIRSDLWDVTDNLPVSVPKPEKKPAPDLAKAFSDLAKLLRHPRAKVLPDATIEAALSILERIDGPAPAEATS